MSYRTWYDPPRKGDEEPFPGSPDDMMNTIAALRARVAKLEGALRLIRRYAEEHDDEFVPFIVDEARAALKETK